MGYRYHPFEVPCSGCRALIVWFRTASGKRMPVNAETTKPTDAARARVGSHWPGAGHGEPTTPTEPPQQQET